MTSRRGKPFLLKRKVEQSLRQLTQEQSLVIYCGAGVTVDRTGLSWNDLVLSVFNESDAAAHLDLAEYEAVRTLLKDPYIDAKKKASVVCEAARAKKENAYLSPILERLLYAENGWQEGYLLRNIARLAVGISIIGRKVRIVTTNYDDYIERAILEELDEWRSSAGSGAPNPGFVVQEKSTLLSKIEPSNGATTIQLLYIHGRKARGRKPNGRLVFSEDSYSKNREQEIDALLGQFNPDAALLVVGASFNDEPLVEALIRSKMYQTTRYALLVSSKGTAAERKAKARIDRLRGEHLGVKILSPESYTQVAQYIDELRILMMFRSERATDEYFESFTFPIRLRAWWDLWSGDEWHRSHDDHFERLRDAVTELRSFFDDYGIRRSGESEEILKLEAWVRVDPSYSRDSRYLTLWANSIGSLRTTEAFRRERIAPESSIAAVSALQHGRPMLLGLSELKFEPKASRWQSYLMVPIFVEQIYPISQVDVSGSTIKVAGTVPVAVMCLASTLADPVMYRELYRELLAQLIGAGRIISGLRVHSKST